MCVESCRRLVYGYGGGGGGMVSYIFCNLSKGIEKSDETLNGGMGWGKGGLKHFGELKENEPA